ncbi:cc8e1bbd-0e91-40cd-b270-b17fd78a363d [Thermothielavioides terrestris]|uniref:Cc8e1bbd-0e91-40cd-b270-b17fd78a363d n=1 Tax=Thermothielavioides terrestris TaxID=2587410 RepID=A0A3S4B1C1_9PEZI|nr:cc8e1bbd-0e91-40cd-b270-b17fd78a363d [Thermothielavioides terrestris]
MSATTFSYAQAARGQTASQPSPQQTSSPAPSTTGSQGKDDASTGATSVTAPSVATNGAEVQDTQRLATQVEGPASKQDSEASSVVGASSSTASVAEQSGKTAQENSTKATDITAQSQGEDKGSRSTRRTSRVNDNTDGRRGRKGKKGLNPWAKRMEAQKAAVKAKLASPDGPAPGSEQKLASSQEDAGARGTSQNGANASQKKSAEAPRPDQAPRKSGTRGNRAGDKDEKNPVSLPPVADPSLWPDPKAAAAREPLPRKPHEKGDTSQKEGQEEAGPPRKKTWEKLEIVHSVVFETQLPQLRGSKPRGGARGGREAGSIRGNHSGAAGAAGAAGTAGTAGAAASQPSAGSMSDKAPSPGGSTGPRAATIRAREGSVPSRSTSQPQAPHPSKRASIDGASRDQRKTSAPGNSTIEHPRDANPDASSLSKRASAVRDIRAESGPLNFEAGQAAGKTQPQERNSFQTRGDYAKDGPHGQQYPARENRPERGRGGGYRGRGGHAGSSSHMGSASYVPNGHYPAPAGFPSRQASSAHSPPPFSGQFPAAFGHPTRGRGSKWAGSGQSAARNSSGAAGFPLKTPQMADFAVGQYPPYMYSPIYDPSIAILKTQVEYYLSVENLCKDYYLRQHMDGQGFAPLSIIADFKRIKAVTEDLELVRLACSLSDQIEFGVGDDGIERLRIRDKWKHFVLPPNERFEPYRNNGPTTFTPYTRPDAHFVAPFPGPIVPQPYPTAAGGAFPAFSEEQMFQPPFVNGALFNPAVNGAVVNGHHHGPESRLSAGVPEYAPPQSPVTLESMTNFSDSQVENLIMVLSYEEKEGSGSSDAAGVAGYVSEDPHGSPNGVSARSPDMPSVNGEAHDGPGNADQPERGIVWLDTQATSSAETQTVRKPYSEIRQAALEQRRNAKAGETSRLMQKLYKFWSQMLLNDFNAKVYQEFRELALEDASREAPVKSGLKYLLELYNRLLFDNNTRKPWPQGRAVPEILTAHYNEAVELDLKLGGKEVTTI